jgi:hypothetical protein
MLQRVIDELKASSTGKNPISQSEVCKWMESDDADTLGATYVFLSKPKHISRVDPPLAFDTVFSFMLKYFEFCLKTDPRSKWANSAYSAGADLVGWFVWMWDDGRGRNYFEVIKNKLAALYISGSPDLKKCIEHAIIEHLFERKQIRKFFGDWKTNPQLQPAYDEGMLWVKGGGTSPLTEPRRV